MQEKNNNINKNVLKTGMLNGFNERKQFKSIKKQNLKI